MPNPCLNGLVCERIGSLGYACSNKNTTTIFPYTNTTISTTTSSSTTESNPQSTTSNNGYIQQNLPNGCLKSFRTAAIATHNQFRALSGVSALIENTTIDDQAQNLITISTDFSKDNTTYGKNVYGQLFASDLTDDLESCSTLGTTCVQSWYNEISRYSFSNPGYSNSTKQYTQLVKIFYVYYYFLLGFFKFSLKKVWKSTRQIGMGLNWSKKDGINFFYVIAYYSPQGNTPKNSTVFLENVLPPIISPTSSSTTTTTTTRKNVAVGSKTKLNLFFFTVYSQILCYCL